MSDTEEQDSKLLSVVLNSTRVGYCVLAAFAVLLYDICLTSSREVDCIWRRRFTAVTALFAINRYATLASMSLQVIAGMYVPKSTISCNAIKYSANVFDVLGAFTFAAFASLRIWAICGRKWFPLLVVLIPSLFIPCINIYNFSARFTVSVISSGPFAGCTFEPLDPPKWTYWPIMTRAVAVTADLVVLVFTCVNTGHVLSSTSRQLHVKSQMSTLLFRNGAVHFLALLVMNVTTMVLNYLNVANAESALGTYFIYVNYSMSSVLISRFFLDLRTAYGEDAFDDLGSEAFSTIHFASRVVGNIGAPLDNSTWTTGDTCEDELDNQVDGETHDSRGEMVEVFR